ncbi:hypothetical protein M107_3425 [Bacteroides fragilis str. 3725 D9(v)]|jgi:hypothetical protein|uniref:Transmembrane protein n=1 Tax=Bacteroides fragilis (strain YCH46) TaxID=295405 RepID=Q64QZ0_BACFR|nr:hypothetical protein M107_3425 [Bacteroides fragilis str. 3725 D9(v)]EYA94909.1 hypothetical protein M141_3186 [Bacteroides fragilis str. S38L5]EYB13391.1 hypothetical protein M140_3135 [Bacteroides fragilis str. S38L3]BAD50091.1 hypothetical protein BF3347 [Bacteroides fragilis YCH46]
MELRKRQVEDGRMELPDIYIWYTLLYVNAVVFLFLFIRGLFYDYIRVSVFGSCVLKAHEEEV